MKKKRSNKTTDIGSSDYGTMEDSASEVEQNSKPSKMKKMSKKEDTSRKKFKSGKLTKQPTTEELNRLRETENLFSSNFFRLQIEEILKEVSVKPKYIKYFNTWFTDFNNFIENLEESIEFPLSEQTWMDNVDIKAPIIRDPLETKGMFKFSLCKATVLLGSYNIGCSLGPDLNVDIKVEMSKTSFYKEDYLNDRYNRKRASYLAYLASKLIESSLVEDVKYKLLNESVSKPVLLFKPTGKANKHVNVILHIGAEENTFKLSRLTPSKNNVREEWRFGCNLSGADSITISTPFYNSAILLDLIYDQNNKHLSELFNDCNNIKQGVILLKIWLKQRNIYNFSGFIMTMFVAYLIKIRRINNAMSSYQVIRNVWTALASSEWDKNGISLCNSNANTLPPLSEFHTHFPVVFVDFTGYYNICTNLSVDVYNTIKYESQLAVNLLDNQNTNGFLSLFMTSVTFDMKYDHILILKYSKKLESAVLDKVDNCVKLDHGPDKYPIVKNYLCDLLRRGLANRIALLTPKCLSDEEKQWSTDCGLKKNNPLKKRILIGIKLNPDYAFNLIDKGPEANIPEALKFREFWGEKSELRRFQDGSISEACVWETSTSIAAKRLIVNKIITYLLQIKLGAEEKIFYVADQFEFILHNKKFQPYNFEYGTGEEAALKVSTALDELMKNFRSLTEMPLEVNSVQGISSVFSYTDPIPPLAYSPPDTKGFMFSENYRLMSAEVKIVPGKRHNRTEFYCPAFIPTMKVVLQLTHSGKWPEDLNALYRIKAAFYVQIAEALKQQCQLTVHPHQSYIDVLKDGYIFRLEIGHQKEVALMKKIVDKDGITKYRDSEESLEVEYRLLRLPKLRVALNGLYHHHQCFGPAACLTKRWLRSHMIDSHFFPDVCIDMLVANQFIRLEPYEVPIQPQVAFWRTLYLLANTDWNSQMIILNFNNDLTKEETIEIESNFAISRSNYPALCLVTPYEDNNVSVWSKHAPTFPILARVKILAVESLKLINDVIFNQFSNDVDIVFNPNMHGFDVLINLKNNCNPLHYLKIDRNENNSVKKITKAYEKKVNEFIPIVDFDPVQIYLKQLRSSYDEFALFFHNSYGGDVIGVLWKPAALEFKEFKTSLTNGRKSITRGDKHGIIADLDAILEGFCILGDGLISNIENVTNKCL